MRKILIILMTMLLMLNLGTQAMGAETELEIPDVEVLGDQTIYVPVILHTAVQGDSIGILYEYDESVLEAQPEFSTWGKKGLLQDFSAENSGVWAAGQVQNLEGTICVLAFRVKSGAALTETEVSCTVTIKNDASKVGTFTAVGKLYGVCNHQYSQWKTQGDTSHIRECSVCAEKQAQSHQWDEGVTTDHPTKDYMALLTQTCKICGATRSREIEGQGGAAATQPSTEPETLEKPEYETRPPQTEPPVEPPTVPQPQKQENTGSQNHTGNRGDDEDRDDSGKKENTGNHSHAGNQGNSENPGKPGNQGSLEEPGAVGNQESISNPNSADRDHNHENDPAASGIPPIAVPAPHATETHIHEVPQETVHDHVHEAPVNQDMGPSLLALLAAAALVVGVAAFVTYWMKRGKQK